MPNTNTKQNKQQPIKSSQVVYVKDAAYTRPIYYLDRTTKKYSIERYGCYDHARDESRTAISKIIHQCDRQGYGIEGFINEVIEMELKNCRSHATEIVKSIPPTTFQVAIDSIVAYECKSKKAVTSALSIRPKVLSDKKGYFVKQIELVDSPIRISRKYKANELKRAF